MSAIKFYRHPLSGHSHRVELLLSLLKLDFETIEIDLMKGEQKSPEFLLKNPNGQVPAIEDGETTLWDSNAILVYLATKYDTNRTFLPSNAGEAAEVQKFLSLAARSIAFGPAAARLVTLFGASIDADVSISLAHQTLAKLESHLANRQWLATEQVTLADIANYAYIALAPEGNVALQDYPNVRDWLVRVESLDGFVAIQSSPVGLKSAA